MKEKNHSKDVGVLARSRTRVTRVTVWRAAVAPRTRHCILVRRVFLTEPSGGWRHSFSQSVMQCRNQKCFAYGRHLVYQGRHVCYQQCHQCRYRFPLLETCKPCHQFLLTSRIPTGVHPSRRYVYVTDTTISVWQNGAEQYRIQPESVSVITYVKVMAVVDNKVEVNKERRTIGTRFSQLSRTDNGTSLNPSVQQIRRDIQNGLCFLTNPLLEGDKLVQCTLTRFTVRCWGRFPETIHV